MSNTTGRPSLSYYRVGNSCCGDDFFQTISSRYDLERLGVSEAERPEVANLIVIQGSVSEKISDEIKKLKDQSDQRTWVMALGACACGGGFFPNDLNDLPRADVWVPGCPPRPEAVMNGVISLREKIERESNGAKSK